jgi:hypothetical protein
MRHSTIDLTMNTYTDPRLLDVHGALDVLPTLPLDRGDVLEEKATGTTGCSRELAPEADQSGVSWSTGDKRVTDEEDRRSEDQIDVSGCDGKRKPSLTSSVNEGHQVGANGFEPSTSASRTQRSVQAELRPVSDVASLHYIVPGPGVNGW